MSDINKVVLVGRLTRDSELKYTGSGFAIGSFSVASNRRVKKGDSWEDEASFFDVTILGKTAENLCKYLTKGKQIALEGCLKQEWWQDRGSGETRSKVVIITEQVQLLGGGGGGGGGVDAGALQGKTTNEVPRSKPYDPYSGDEFPEEIPF